jgi:murein L,D-transpeptidase YafK
MRRAAAAFLAAVAMPLVAHGSEPLHGGAERELRHVLESLGEGRLDTALAVAERLVAHYPTFRLAHLVRGDLLLARAQPLKTLGSTGHAANRLEELRAEALARLRAARDGPAAGAVPRHLLTLAPAQTHALVVDASRSRVYVYENKRGEPQLVADYYSTLGKRGIGKQREGDQKTPLGVYHVTSMIPGAKLPDLYGWGAFPINYPNDWDRRAGRTGHGIWLHGVPSESYARAPRASDGCIALANDEIAELAKRVRPGATPVVIAGRAEWVKPEQLRAEREEFLRQLESWRGDWESRDIDRYLSHYSREFRAGAADLAAWSVHKRRVNAAKRWVKIELANVSVLRSGGQSAFIEVTFEQDYRSNNLSNRTRKRQYWVEEDGRWKVVYEGAVGSQNLRLPESFKSALTTSRTGS